MQFVAAGTISRSGFRFVSEIGLSCVCFTIISWEFATGHIVFRSVSFFVGGVDTPFHHFLVVVTAVTTSRLGFQRVLFQLCRLSALESTVSVM